MTQKIDEPVGGLTRRSALKAGVALSSGLAFGGTAVGTVGAAKVAGTDNAMPVHLFVRDHKDDEPSPVPDSGDKIVERRQGHPIDDGTELGHDGRWLTWGEFSDVEGSISVDCRGSGTDVSFKTSGLIPNVLYTAWVVVFEDPGFDKTTRDFATAFENLVGVGSLGKNDGSENVFRADSEGEAMVSANHPKGDLSVFGEVGNCLLDEFEVHFVGAGHLDDQTWGPIPEPEGRGSLAEQFSFMWVDGEFL